MIEHNETELSVSRQCELLGVARSSLYYRQKPVETNNAMILNEIREIYQKTPFYGYRRMNVELRRRGIFINHKKLQNLLKIAGIQALYPTKKTSIKNPGHKIHPYLLKGLTIERPNQVWEVDFTYIKMRYGFVYLVCLIDVFSRKIMGWDLSTFLNTKSCMDALKEGLKRGQPEIVNSDQGCQFTSALWTGILKDQNIQISMDGVGRWADNIYVERLWRSVKYEVVFLHSFDTVLQARNVLSNYIDFYNRERPHQSLNYHTPDHIYSLGKKPTKQELFAYLHSLHHPIQSEGTMIPKYA
jgi:putative transposase